MNQFPRFFEPEEAPITPRRGGFYEIEQASFRIDGLEYVCFDDFTSGQALCSFRFAYVIPEGEDAAEVEAIQMGAPGEDNWQDLPSDHPLHWAAEALLNARKQIFQTWASENAVTLPHRGRAYINEYLNTRFGVAL